MLRESVNVYGGIILININKFMVNGISLSNTEKLFT